MDDSEAMLAEYRKSQNADVSSGATAFMQVMLTATALVDQPPDVSQLLPVPYFVPVMINDQLLKIRLIAPAMEQLVF